MRKLAKLDFRTIRDLGFKLTLVRYLYRLLTLTGIILFALVIIILIRFIDLKAAVVVSFFLLLLFFYLKHNLGSVLLHYLDREDYLKTVTRNFVKSNIEVKKILIESQLENFLTEDRVRLLKELEAKNLILTDENDDEKKLLILIPEKLQKYLKPDDLLNKKITEFNMIVELFYELKAQKSKIAKKGIYSEISQLLIHYNSLYFNSDTDIDQSHITDSKGLQPGSD